MAAGDRWGAGLSARDVAAIQKLVDAEPWLSREAIARRVCKRFGWRQHSGHWAVRSCRNILERLERGGSLRLPPAQRRGNFIDRRRLVIPTEEAAPAAAPIGPVLAGPLVVRPLAGDPERRRWRIDMARHHYLGCPTLVAEALCYTAWVGEQAVAHLGWAAAALRNAPRDHYLGWDEPTKHRRLYLVVNNVRFLILPGVAQKNLASRILAANLRRLATDWQVKHGHTVLLAETFVDSSRFVGTCYRAANWLYAGQTRGFSRCGPGYRPNGCPKAVFVYPLHRRARQWLAGAQCGVAGREGIEEEVRMLEVEKLPLADDEGLWEVLRGLTDPRHRRGIRHSMVSVLALAVVATLCGAKSLAAIAQFAQELPEEISRRLRVRRSRPPSEPTFRRVLKAIDVHELDRRLGQWMARHSLALGKAVAVDGKTVRGSADGERPAIHLLAALTHDEGLVLAQRCVADKTNEIPTVVPLLQDVELRGAVVTADAMHTQKETASYLVEDKGADYLFTVKDNQPTLRQDIQHLGHGGFPPRAAPQNSR